MTREMMEEIFADYCARYDLAWYELFDSDLFLSVVTIIGEAYGITVETSEDILDSLFTISDVFTEWYGEMAGDL